MNLRAAVLFVCVLLCCFTAMAQTSQSSVAQIERKIAACNNDSNKVLLYVTLADSLVAKNSPAEALAVSQKALALAQKLNYTHGIIASLIRAGSVNEEVKKDYVKAIGYYKEAIKIAEAHSLYTDENLTYGCILNMYYYIGDYPNAMGIAQRGLALAEQKNDKAELAHYNDQLGFIFLKQEKPAESIKYYRQYLNLATQVGNTMMLADANNCIADVYLFNKDYKTSLLYLFKAADIYKKSANSSKTDRVVYTDLKISNIYKLEGDYQTALKYALLGLNYQDGNRKTTYNPYDLASYYINTGEVYIGLKNYTNAMRFLYKGRSLSRSILHREDMLDAYSALSHTYALQNRYDSAYHYQAIYSALKDSIINEKASRAVELIRDSFESDKKDKEIAMLNQRQRLREAEAEKQTLRINTLVGFIALLAVISYFIIYIRNNQKQQRLAREKQLAIEAERQRISNDMHDDLGTGLSTMLIYVNLLKAKLKKGNELNEIERVAVLGNELVSHMKEIVWSLNPGNDSLESLLIFIRQYFVQLFEPLPYRTTIVFPQLIPEVVIHGAARRNVYLCIKEALNNVIKHSGADRVELNIGLHPGKLTITVKDNGIGFPDNSEGKFFSNGLKNMKHRMELINGDFDFFNEDGAVITIELDLGTYPNG